MNKILVILALVFFFQANGQPSAGDVFREYIWLPEKVNSERGKYLRVGGKLDYKHNEAHFPSTFHANGFITIESYIELEHVTKAEVIVEKIGSHVDTRGLRISLNGNDPHYFPEAAGIPTPQSEYMHHTNPIVSIPLTDLKKGYGNSFRLDVDSIQRWDWPQNLIYGLILRVYYDYNENYANGIKVDGGAISIQDPNQSVREVQYLAKYDGINYEGDGVYNQWHYKYVRGKLKHHIGTAHSYPYKIAWDTSLVPDQEESVDVAARIVYNDGVILWTESRKFTLPNRDYGVFLAKPYDQPKNWVTRSKQERREFFNKYCEFVA